MRDRYALRDAVRRASAIFHFAAQVAVTTSLVDPVTDFEVNAARHDQPAGGAARAAAEPPPLVFTSTNKVYGELDDVELEARGRAATRRVDRALRARGIGETQPLDFYSPYGCSKGAADQYVLDYARIYGLPTAVFRMSCIYGPHQFGTEDQGWVAHFLLRALDDEPITIYGDGQQVRDILYVDDLVEALLLARATMRRARGPAFNIGGGPANAVSLLEVLERDRAAARPPRCRVRFGRLAAGRSALLRLRHRAPSRAATGWRPRVGVGSTGLGRLWRWLSAQRGAVARGRPQIARGAA